MSKIGLESKIFIVIGWSLSNDKVSGERVERKCGQYEVILLMMTFFTTDLGYNAMVQFYDLFPRACRDHSSSTFLSQDRTILSTIKGMGVF